MQPPRTARQAEDPVGVARDGQDQRQDQRQDRLPPGLERALAAFERHLTAERGLSPHTVRAYLGDVGALLGHAAEDGCAELADLDIQVLRAWLGGAAPGRAGPDVDRPAGGGGARVHRVRPRAGLARQRSRAAAGHAQDGPAAARRS